MNSANSSDAPFAYPHPKEKLTGVPFWVQRPDVLWDKYSITQFFPSRNLNVVENLNAIVRLSIYLGILLILYTQSSFYLWVPITGFVITYLIYSFYPHKNELFMDPPCDNIANATCTPEILLNKKRDQQERLDREVERTCIQPTVDNPFMNFNYISDDYHKPPGCKAFLENTKENRKIQKEVKKSFNYNLYRNVGDLYGKNNSQRQFFTMPWTSWPNDQTSFAKWLYSTGPTCKENGMKCAPYWNPYATYSDLQKGSA